MTFKLSIALLVMILLPIVNSSHGAILVAQTPQHDRQFDSEFKEHYSGRKYNYEGREIVGSSTSKFGNRSKYSKNQPTIKESNNTGNSSLNFNIVNGIFIFILFLAVSYLAYTLLQDGSSQLFYKARDKLTSYGDITADNIQQADIKALIETAENNNNYRLAIRYYYLLVLKQLTVKKYIIFKDDKTNADYMNAIATEKFSTIFAHTSYIYNHAWYGEFQVDTKQYQLAKAKFVQLINSINT